MGGMQIHTAQMTQTGPERTQLERRARASWLGNRDGDRVRAASSYPLGVGRADIVVLPSIYEELGRVLVEAMQLGVPVVASGWAEPGRVAGHEKPGPCFARVKERSPSRAPGGSRRLNRQISLRSFSSLGCPCR